MINSKNQKKIKKKDIINELTKSKKQKLDYLMNKKRNLIMRRDFHFT